MTIGEIRLAGWPKFNPEERAVQTIVIANSAKSLALNLLGSAEVNL